MENIRFWRWHTNVIAWNSFTKLWLCHEYKDTVKRSTTTISRNEFVSKIYIFFLWATKISEHTTKRTNQQQLIDTLRGAMSTTSIDLYGWPNEKKKHKLPLLCLYTCYMHVQPSRSPLHTHTRTDTKHLIHMAHKLYGWRHKGSYCEWANGAVKCANVDLNGFLSYLTESVLLVLGF